MKEAKPVKFNLHQHQEHQNGHLAPFKLAKLFDPEASWDKRNAMLINYCCCDLNLPNWWFYTWNSHYHLLFEDLIVDAHDQLGDVLHWIRQAVAVVLGLLWGSIPLVGGIWFILFLAISTSIVYGYYAMILKVDEEEFGGHGALLQEGLFASITLFLLAWTLVYSLAHF